jgi:hypothetical protein
MNIIMEDNHSENPLPSSSMGELVVDRDVSVANAKQDVECVKRQL